MLFWSRRPLKAVREAKMTYKTLCLHLSEGKMKENILDSFAPTLQLFGYTFGLCCTNYLEKLQRHFVLSGAVKI